MILKQYQKDIIEDLTRYLEILQKTKNISESFNEFWRLHPRTPLTPFPGEIVEPYKNNVAGVPHVCLKVPTDFLDISARPCKDCRVACSVKFHLGTDHSQLF